MNLYQASQLATLQNHVDPETGEIDIDAFNDAQIALADKQKAVCAYVKNADARIAMVDDAIKQLSAKKKAMQTQRDNLYGYLLVNMQHHGITEITADDHTFTAKIKKNPPKVVIEDQEYIEKEYGVEKVSVVVDKTRLKNDLKAGKIVSGAHLEQGERLEIK